MAAAPGSELDTAAGWRTVAAAFVSMAVVFGVGYSFGAFFVPMAAEFGTGSGATSLVFAITAFCWFQLSPVTGRIADRIGPRPVLLAGAAALAAGLLLTATVRQLWVGYLTYGAGVGIAVACGYVPLVAAVGGWFERRRAVAMAVAVAGIGVGTLLGAPLAATLIATIGWRGTHVVFGLAGAALLVGCAAVVRRPPQPAGVGSGPPLRVLAGMAPFRSMYATTLLAAFALFVPVVHLPVYAATSGASPVAGATLVGIIGVASVVGRIALGAIADRFGRVRTFQASFAVLAAAFGLWLGHIAFGGPFAVLVAFAVVLGVGYGGWIALQPAVIADAFGVRGLGWLVGLVYTAAGIGALLGVPVAGALVDATGGYGWAAAAAGLCGLGAFAVSTRLDRADFAR
ncbi:MFS transporter [Pseudonocardia sp. DSM 110487]|uniref:MFS transporter n=1 Tax=Pseudonocardia sp. DSM 110487 TaxID=2865833 RepID=UPI001C6A6CB1|nr:MFS transporter [Pseudonocardia sp. DSM 110487]QYN33470.1 MFS transporter [Pseudonocardia sp. DSM 110487]